MTSAGSIALANAAQLAGLVLSQLKREGSPIILGARGGGLMDMRSMVSLYAAPDSGPFGWDLANSYGIPTFTAACTDAKIFDGQAAAETALSLFDKALNGASIIHDLGYLDCAMTGSLELVAFCDEVVGWIKQYWQPLEITDETLALDLIHEMGPNGQFIKTDHTFRHVRETWIPEIFDRNNYHSWSAKGSFTLQQRANKKVLEIIENHRAEPLPQSVVQKLEAIAA
jgi:trimethylamine--corrinoid protein Co-methyltransferase